MYIEYIRKVIIIITLNSNFLDISFLVNTEKKKRVLDAPTKTFKLRNKHHHPKE